MQAWLIIRSILARPRGDQILVTTVLASHPNFLTLRRMEIEIVTTTIVMWISQNAILITQNASRYWRTLPVSQRILDALTHSSRQGLSLFSFVLFHFLHFSLWRAWPLWCHNRTSHLFELLFMIRFAPLTVRVNGVLDLARTCLLNDRPTCVNHISSRSFGFLFIFCMFCIHCSCTPQLFWLQIAQNPKKCRAVFGLEQQQLWCAPCR